MSAPTRRRLTAEERRAGILDAALAVFSARGYYPSSIDDIAREAGISKALIYEHFESKQGLYADLLERNAASCSSGSRRRSERWKPTRAPSGWPPGSTRSSASSRSAATRGASSSATPPTPSRARCSTASSTR